MLVVEGTQCAEPFHRDNGLIRPYWSEELQRLYDRWRDSVYYQEFDNFLQADRRSGSLPVPSMRRSLSVTSGGSSSSALSTSTAPDEDEPLDQDQKPRRRGPLSKSKREQTAFIRRLGACSSCRSRKVGCKHWDLGEFEECYLYSKMRDRELTLNGLHLQSPVEFGTSSDEVGLLGLEQKRSLAQWQCQMAAELPVLPRSYPIPMMEPSSPVNLGQEPFENSVISMAEREQDYKPRLMHIGPLMAIGNDLLAPSSNDVSHWQCLFNNTYLPLTRGLGSTCSGRFDSADKLVAHFRMAHHPIRLHESPIWYKCRKCAQWNNEYHYCLQCGVVGSGSQEQWIQAYTLSHCDDGALAFE